MAERLWHAVYLCWTGWILGPSLLMARRQGQHAKDAATDVPDAVVGAGLGSCSRPAVKLVSKNSDTEAHGLMHQETAVAGGKHSGHPGNEHGGPTERHMAEP
jgi:hypothetical protein